MLIEVRGSAAGGGFQQWNCNSSNCADKGFGGLTPHPIIAGSQRWGSRLCVAQRLEHRLLGCGLIRRLEANRAVKSSADVSVA